MFMIENTVTLVATDLDGTLLNNKKEVSEINKKAIRDLKQNGIFFGIASGRPVETILKTIEDWGMSKDIGFVMGMNGGAIYDYRLQSKEEYYLLDGEIVIEIMDFFKGYDVKFWILIGDDRYVNVSTEQTRAHARLYKENEIYNFYDDDKYKKLFGNQTLKIQYLYYLHQIDNRVQIFKDFIVDIYSVDWHPLDNDKKLDIYMTIICMNDNLNKTGDVIDFVYKKFIKALKSIDKDEFINPNTKEGTVNFYVYTDPDIQPSKSVYTGKTIDVNSNVKKVSFEEINKTPELIYFSSSILILPFQSFNTLSFEVNTENALPFLSSTYTLDKKATCSSDNPLLRKDIILLVSS